MPREHDFVPEGHDWVCKHCGVDAFDITLAEVNGEEIPCVNWTDIPKVKRKPKPPTIWQEIKEIIGW